MISLPKGVDLNDLIGFLRDIGLKASSILRNLESESIPLYGSSDNLNLINNEDGPVTAADLTLNKLFITEFISRYPKINWQVITEENSKLVPFQESNCDWIWLIDPLDGTKDFLQRTGEYAVHVSLDLVGVDVSKVACPNFQLQLRFHFLHLILVPKRNERVMHFCHIHVAY